MLQGVEKDLMKTAEETEAFSKNMYDKIKTMALTSNSFLSFYLLFHIVNIIIVAKEEILHQHHLYKMHAVATFR